MSFPFHDFRRSRFGGRPSCPRCGADHVQRWGSFSGRRRYRCVACRRTFSDFTGTALAYVKRLPAWYPYCRCLLDALTVRASAQHAGVSRATAFRWRHRVMAALRRGDGVALGLTIALHETWFQQSEKGSRSLDRPPRRRSIYRRHDATPVWVLIARDEAGRVASDVTGLLRPQPNDVIRLLGERVAPDAELVSRFGRYGAPARAADALELGHRTEVRALPEIAAVRTYVVSLRRWMRRFHGVATRYLANYLAWHRFVAAAGPAGNRSERDLVAALSAGRPP